MAAITVRGLSDETHRGIKARARANNRSAEAEVRAILDGAVKPSVGIGSVLAAIGAEFGGVDLDADPEAVRSQWGREPLDFS